jgi:hypothetical protein
LRGLWIDAEAAPPASRSIVAREHAPGLGPAADGEGGCEGMFKDWLLGKLAYMSKPYYSSCAVLSFVS